MLKDPIENIIAKFEYKELDKIHGRPTLSSIVHMYNQLKCNTQSIITTLGGGRYGYLALTLTAVEYNRLPHSAPFLCPADPGVFRPIAPGVTCTSRPRSASASTTSAAAPTLPSATKLSQPWMKVTC